MADAYRQYGVVSQYKPVRRQCPYCGAKFYPITPVQRYCSHSHRQMGYERRKQGLPERRIKRRS